MYHPSTKRLFIGKRIFFFYDIDETTRLIDAWVRSSSLKNTALKATMIMPNLLLQKPSKDPKTKNHTKTLERRLHLWTDGHLAELLKEGETIQSSLKLVNARKTTSDFEKVCRPNPKR